MSYLFEPAPIASVSVLGCEQRFPVHRIYCVGKNYADHIREMGSDPARDEPCFFLKPTDALVLDGKVPYPPGTKNYHYEGELVLALDKGGSNISPETAHEHIFGYAAGLDMTRRDLQLAAGKIGMPWDTGKGFDYSAPLSALTRKQDCGLLTKGSIQLWVNDQLRQNADLADLIWKSHEIISQLSRLYTLQPGDLIFTGTPAGVGAVVPGDRLRLAITGLSELQVQITAPL
jgi:fumarylpyruvate hydrolase